MQDTISIIVPIYNVELYLKRCIDSLLNQSYKNLEIILVNDGSPDRSGEICDDYAKMDARVKVIHKKNGGLSDARNAGLEYATGKYVSFIDSDDWVNEDYVLKLHTLIVQSESDIAVSNFIRVYDENFELTNTESKVEVFTSNEALEQIVGDLYVQIVIACGKLFNRALFEDIKFPVGKIHEDEFTTYKLLGNSKKVVYTSEELYYYFQREDSIMGVGITLKSRMHAFEALNERIAYFNDKGLNVASDKLVRRLFGVYRVINSEFYLKNKVSSEIVKELKKTTKSHLKNSNVQLPYKLIYHLYFIMPKTIDWISNLLRK